MSNTLVSVRRILSDLGLSDKPQLVLFNKCDQLTTDQALHRASEYDALCVSAFDRKSFGQFLVSVEQELWKEGLVSQEKLPLGDCC